MRDFRSGNGAARQLTIPTTCRDLRHWVKGFAQRGEEFCVGDYGVHVKTSFHGVYRQLSATSFNWWSMVPEIPNQLALARLYSWLQQWRFWLKP